MAAVEQVNSPLARIFLLLAASHMKYQNYAQNQEMLVEDNEIHPVLTCSLQTKSMV